MNRKGLRLGLRKSRAAASYLRAPTIAGNIAIRTKPL